VQPLKPSPAGNDRRQAGFTLLEMLVVLTLIGLIMAAVPALLSAGLPGLRLEAEARELVDNLRIVHISAMREHRERIVTFDTDAHRYRLAPTEEEIRIPTGMTLRVRDFPFAETKGAIARIRFFPDGSSSGGNVGLIQGGQQYWIGIDWLTGRVFLRD